MMLAMRRTMDPLTGPSWSTYCKRDKKKVFSSEKNMPPKIKQREKREKNKALRRKEEEKK